jgi:TRAP-type mannitol/chloroaromatic compound transport system substrate-binding protein
MWQLEINLDRWNEMSQAQKGLIGEACRQNIAQAVREYAANAKAALDRLKARKVQVHTFSKDILDAVRSARDGLILEFSAKDPDFKRAWESYSSFR